MARTAYKTVYRFEELDDVAKEGVERWNAKAGQRLAEWTEADEAAADRAADRIAGKATDILAPYGATLESISGDPRGYCLKFRLANGESMGC